ncbi:MAG: hypothetical protein ACREBU_07480 [Nitrososphaera sp.]
MPRSLLLSDRCEYYDEKTEVCGRPAFSLSVEHGEVVFCKKHYEGWLGVRRVQNAQFVLSGLTSEEKKALVKSLGSQ